MPGKKTDEKIINQFIARVAAGDSMESTMEITGIGKSTYYNWTKKYAKEIENKKKELSGDNSNDGKAEPPKQEDGKPPKNEKKKPKFASIEDETTTKTIRKGSDSISDLKAKELTEDYKAAQMLHSASVRYKANIEMMGLDWDRFVAWCIDEGYERAVEAYKERLEQYLKETALLATEMEAELTNPKMKTEDGMEIEEEGE